MKIRILWKEGKERKEKNGEEEERKEEETWCYKEDASIQVAFLKFFPANTEWTSGERNDGSALHKNEGF